MSEASSVEAAEAEYKKARELLEVANLVQRDAHQLYVNSLNRLALAINYQALGAYRDPA